MCVSIGTPVASVAVIIRTKNRPVLLRRAVEDVLSQTHADFMMVVVNDGGERAPVDELLESLSDRLQGRLVLVHNPVSRGRAGAANVGLDACVSEFVAIHDDDDTWAPTFLAECVDYLTGSGEAGVAVRTDVVYEQLDGDRIVELRREAFADDHDRVTLAETLHRNYTPTNSLVYRRDVHEAIGRYAEDLPVLEDWDFLLRLLARYNVGFLDGKPLAFWHHRPDAIGADGNSVIAEADDHLCLEDAVRARHLAADVRDTGGLGVLLYLTGLADRHSAGAARHLEVTKAHLETRLAQSLEQRDAAVLAELHDLNQNLVSQSNRLVAQFERLNRQTELIERLIRDNAPRARLRRYGRGLTRRIARVAGRGDGS